MSPVIQLNENTRWYTQLGWAVNGRLMKDGMYFECHRVLSVNADQTPHLELDAHGAPFCSIQGTIRQDLRSVWEGKVELDTVEEMLLLGNMMAMCAMWTKEVYGQQGGNLHIEHRGPDNARR